MRDPVPLFQQIASGAKRLPQVLRWFAWEAPPTKQGSNAGSRKEGNQFKSAIIELLTPVDTHHNVVIVTATGKSTDGKKIDGNVSLERQSHKMLQFKLDPFMQDNLMVVALNEAFKKYENKQLGELLAHAAWLNAIDNRAQIKILSSAQDYRDYCKYVFGEEE